MWDVLLDISTGNVTVAKDIHATYPVSNTAPLSAPMITRTGTLKTEASVGSEDEIARMAKEGLKGDLYKDNNADRIFIEDVSACDFVTPSRMFQVDSGESPDPSCNRRPLRGDPRAAQVH